MLILNKFLSQQIDRLSHGQLHKLKYTTLAGPTGPVFYYSGTKSEEYKELLQ